MSEFRTVADFGRSTRRCAHYVFHAARCAVEVLESRVLLSVNVTTYHYDTGETGANTSETILTPSNVNVSTFGKVASMATDGQVYAQPLIVTGVSVPGQGAEDLVFIATENDSVYAFNAQGTSTTPVWKTSLLQAGESAIPAGGPFGSANIAPEIGITGTPVIDPATDTLYVVGDFKEANGTYQARLYALDITTGAYKDGGPVQITATVGGTGAGSSGGMLTFSAILENQRPALTLANGEIYVAFASHGDGGNYHGWVLAYSDSTLIQDYVWCDTPNGQQGGIWMSGGGLAVDSSGDLYLTSGNGSFDANTGGSEFGMSLAKLDPTLNVLDYFSPYNEASLSNGDEDYGCGNVVLLPTQSGTAPDEALTVGKWGGIYLNNSDTGKLGEFTPNGPNKDLAEASTEGTQHNTFAYWNGTMYVGADGEVLKAFAVSNGSVSPSPLLQSRHIFGSGAGGGEGCSPTISSSGSSNGIVWAIDNSAYSSSGLAVVYAYDASNLSQMLWNSSQAANGRDNAGTAIQFTTPIVANGYVYVAGGSGLTIYGNIPYTPPPPPPAPPPPPPPGALTGFAKFVLNDGTGNPAGVPAISADGGILTLTTAAGNEASSAIYNAPVGYQNFTATFTYTDTQGNPPADGITFILEEDPRAAKAVGGGGGGLGYGGITPSFAAAFDVYGGSSSGYATNGAVAASTDTGNVNLASGDPINVTLSYNSSAQTLTETLNDQAANGSYATTYSGINLSGVLGSNTAYIGFTGGTGAASSLQTISNFAYYTTPLWLSTTSAAAWNASTHTLTVTGSATIIADPGTDEPNIVASGTSAVVNVTPINSPTDVHMGGVTLSNGASMTMASVGSSRSHANHNTLVLGTLGAANDPTFSIDSQSKLDLQDNDLIVHTGSSDANGSNAYSTVAALAALGRNPAGGVTGQPNGQWNGNGLESSSAASADTSAGYEKIGLAVVLNSSLLMGSYSAWQVGTANETLGADDIIVKYDYLGDYALEGQVSQDDAGILQLEYDNGASSGHTWATGSSLYDGLSDNTEAGLFQLQYGLGTGGNQGDQL